MKIQEYYDYIVKNSPLNDVRLQAWEKLYPGCGDEFGEIFGTQMPTPKEVATWKMGWIETTPYQFVVTDRGVNEMLMTPGVKEDIFQLASSLGIHPYFWEFWKHRETRKETQGLFDHEEFDVVVLYPTVSFFYEEHHVMFKMAW